MNNFSVNNSLVKSKLKTGLLHLVILAFSILICSLIGCSSSKNDAHSTASSTENNKELTPVTLNEVAHSIFYAPQYTAIELGYFEQEVVAGNRQTPLEAVWDAFPALNQAEVRAALAR